MRVLVFGAGGRIGSRLLDEALDRGHEVVGVHRSAVVGAREEVRLLEGDVRTPFELVRDVAPDAVVSAVGAGATTEHPDYAVYLDAAHALCDALRTLGGGPRLIAVGGAGSLRAGDGVLVVDTPQFPGEFRQEALAQARALELLRGVGDVAWTYVSPAAVIEPGPRTGVYRVGGDDLLVDADGLSRISMEDYAVALLDELERPRAVRRRITVAY